MTMMSLQILLPLNTFPGSNGETFLGNALSVAAFLEGELEALVLAADFRQVSNALGNLVLDVPSLVAGAREQCREKGAALVRSLKDQANVSGVRVRSSEIECHPAVFGDRATVASRYHDLVLMGLASSDDSLRSTAEAVIFGSGRPVMLLPEQHAIGRLDHVMVAWDGSRVAARAVNDARIVLERAEKVTITVVVDEKTLPDQSLGARLAAYLTSHGLNVEHSEIRGAGRPIAGVLQDEAARIGAGILVMGGFGHSRMRDFVLGGATRGILADLRMPVLLSH
jgi:nucleotide-binding universal stress UspA family protein